jgi:hypothetical protein
MYFIYPTLLDAFQYYLDNPDSEKQEMIDRVNRVPFVNEAADKGTAFNELVDKIISGIEITGDEMQYLFERPDRKWIFTFKCSILKQFVERLNGSVPQIYLSSELNTKYGPVLLYGYADEIKGDTIYDIKTTSRYEFPKFLKNWQHRAYLHAQHESYIDRFQYLVTDFNSVFTEDYTYLPKYENELVLICERLIEFIESNKELITDQKIFGNQNVITYKF